MRRLLPSPLSRPGIDEIWSGAAGALGFKVLRTGEAYASSDGKGRIFIGIPEILDVDDSFAQLVFHELCHALIEGPTRQDLPDWGLETSGVGDVAQEHACLRVQAHLARPHGLRELMAPTTEYRAYHDTMPVDVLAPGDDRAIALAQAALARSPSWLTTLSRALAATAASVADPTVLQRHPLGFALGPAAETCGSCAWFYLGGRGRAVARCRQAAAAGDGESAARTSGEVGACERWEKPVACQSCGACCREAYHVVSVSMRDPVVWKQPDFVVRHGHRFEVLRAGERCAALDVTAVEGAPDADGAVAGGERHYSCRIYDDRPRTCREFTAGGQHCLEARRRVGLSR